MRGPAVILLAACLLTVGCLGTTDDVLGDDDPDGPATLTTSPPVDVSTRWPGAEPVVDTGPDGTLYIEGIGTAETQDGTRNVNRVWRSTDGGQSWTDVTPPATANASSNDGYVAVGPDGTVFAANVFGLTFQVFKSTDQGETWTPVNVPRIPGLMHRHWIEPVGDGTVHITVEALDPAAAPILAGLPSQEGTVDTQVNKGMYHTVSTDNGDTWSQPQRIDPQINYAGQSNLAVSPDAQALYIVRYEEDEAQPIQYDYADGTFYLLASHDAGETWERVEMFELSGEMGSALTSLTIDPTGLIYFTWAQETDGRSVTHVAISHDGGQTWTTKALALSDGTQAMPFARALGPGELAVLWYDAHAQGMPSDTDLGAGWHIHVAHVTGAETAKPQVEVRKLTGTVHEGNICVLGPACSGEQDRRLLDYVWIDQGPNGTAHLAWSSTMWDRPSAYPVYASMVTTGDG